MANKFLNGINITGTSTLNTVANAGVDTDKFLVLDSSGNVDFRTGNELLVDIGVSTSYVPYTGATAAVNLGPNNLGANSLVANGTGSYSGTLALKQNGLIPASTGYTTLSSSSVGKLNIYFGNITMYAVTLQNDLLTESRSYDFPNASGTLALKSDLTNFVTLIGVQTLSNKTFSDVVNLGNNGFKIAGITGVNPVQMFMSNSVSTYLFNTNSFGININNDIFYSKDANNRAVLSFNNTAERIYTFPNASGTLALVGDLSGYVTLATTQTISGAKTFGSSVNINTSGQASLSITSTTGNSSEINSFVGGVLKSTISTSATEFKLISAIDNILKFQSSNLFKASLIFSNTADYSYTFPAASGTLALASDLSGYVTLGTDQTITGRKTFSVASKYNQGISFNTNGTYTASAGYNGIGGTSTGLRVVMGQTTVHDLNFSSTGPYSYTFPSASGTLALTTDIPSSSTFVPYTGATATLNLGSQMLMTSGYIRGGNSLQVLYNPSSSTYDAGYNTIQGNATSFAVINPTTGFRLIFPSTASYFYTLPDATGTIALTSNLSSYIPYTGATANVNLGVYSLTANAIVKNGGVDTQFLKADGSVDNNVYLTANDLPSTLSLYATTAAASVSGYFKLVTTIDDPDFNTTAVDVSTGVITATDQLIASLVSPPNLINGNPGVFNVTTYGNIKKVSGSGESEFYFKIYKRSSAGVETLVGTSSNTIPVVNTGYSEFFATAVWNDGDFGVTDTIVLKYYATRISGGSNPTYNFQFGGTSPVRTIVPIPTAVIPNIYLEELADVEDGIASNNDGIYYDSAVSLWKYKSIAEVLGYTPANDSSVVHIAGTETITGVKTFTPSVIAASLIARGVYLNPSLTASAANDGLYALDVSPSFSNGAFTGVTNNGIRITTSTNRAFGGLLVSNTSSTGTSTAARMQVSSNTASVQLSSTASSYSTYGMTSASSNLLYASAGALSIISADSFISLGTGASGGTEGLRMFNVSRNIQIKNGGTFADNGFKLEVVGTTRITDVLTLGSTISNGTYSYMLPGASGQLALTSDFIYFAIPYTGALQNVDLGVYSITASSLIKSGGTSAQILAADGSVITAGTNITISGGTISSTGGGGGSMAIGSAITSATAGSVLFAGVGGILQQDNTNFFFDDTNNRLGIGTASPSSKLTISSSTNGSLFLIDGLGGSNANFQMQGVGEQGFRFYNTATTGSTRVFWKLANRFNVDWQWIMYTDIAGTGSNDFVIQNSTHAGTFYINPSGNFGLGTLTVGSKLQVNGNAAIGYSASTAAPTNGLAVNGQVAIGTNTTTNLLQVTGSRTAASALAAGVNFTPTLVAAANGDILVGLDINPTFTNGAFSGLSHIGMRIFGSTAGNSPSLEIRQTSNTSPTWLSVRNSGNYGVAGAVAADLGISGGANQFFDNTAQGDIAFKAYSFGSTSKFFIGATQGTQANLVLLPNGNVGVGATTTIGSKLQVNGNAAIGYSASTAAPTNGLAVAGNLGVGTSAPTTYAGYSTLAINGTTGGVIDLMNNGTVRGQLSVGATDLYVVALGVSSQISFLTSTVTRAVITSSGSMGLGTSTPVASALLQLSSTTKGFLPPVMTSAQRIAISSPATGLIVYQSDGVEGLWIKTSTTWRQLTVV